MNSKADWKVRFDTFLTHIRHDIEKGIDNQVYNWQNIRIERRGNEIAVFQTNRAKGVYTISALGSAEQHSQDNRITDNLDLGMLLRNAKMSQHTGNNATIRKQENVTMNTNSIVNEAVSTIKTVGTEIQASAVTSAKMEAGENILLALRNIVMAKAGFMQKVKFKFAPVALDVAVTVGADILVQELMPNKKSAKLATECLNLAMTKEIIHSLPIKDFTNALTGGAALKQVQALINNDED